MVPGAVAPAAGLDGVPRSDEDGLHVVPDLGGLAVHSSKNEPGMIF